MRPCIRLAGMGLMVQFLLFMLCLSIATSATTAQSEGVNRQEALELRDEVRSMFYHAYNNYMEHAFPLDELRPLSCGGEDSLGGYSLTVIDAMDTLALLGDAKEFSKAVRWISHNVDFNKNKTVSIFETNIRVLGGLLSAHLLASDQSTGMAVDGYDGELLELAKDLGERFLPAFYTPTGIPFGSVNLQNGVPPEETTVTSTAAGGTLAVEFGMLSRLTGNPVFEDLALQSLQGLWSRRSHLGLVGAHIDVYSGEWTHRDAGIGTSIDSFYEYLLKAHLLLGGDEYLHMFTQAYQSALQHLHVPPWYLEVNMDDGMLVWPLFNSLQAFWPGLQVLTGDVEAAAETHAAFYGVWRRFGFTPEGFNLLSGDVQPGQNSYPLRPELAESTYWLYRATRDPMYLHVGRDIIASIQYGATCPCGYCHVADVKTHEKEDHMESFFLSETMKYLWLLFDSALGGDNLVENGPYPYVFSTEGHLFPIRPDLSLEKPPDASAPCETPPEKEAEPTLAEPTIAEPTLVEPTLLDATLVEPTLVDVPSGPESNSAQPEFAEPTTDGQPTAPPSSPEPVLIRDGSVKKTTNVSKASVTEALVMSESEGLLETGVSEEAVGATEMETETAVGGSTERNFDVHRDVEVSVRKDGSSDVIDATIGDSTKDIESDGNVDGKADVISDVANVESPVAESTGAATAAGGQGSLSTVTTNSTEPADKSLTAHKQFRLTDGRVRLLPVNVGSPVGSTPLGDNPSSANGVREESAKERLASEQGGGEFGGGNAATCLRVGPAESNGLREAGTVDGDVSGGAKDDVSGEVRDDVSGGGKRDVSGGAKDDVSRNDTDATAGNADAWDVWSDEGVRPLVGRCPTLSFWRHVGVHNLVPFPPSADTVTNLEQIQMRSKQRQMHQTRIANFFQQAAQANHVAQSQGQRFKVTVDQQGQLFFQQVPTAQNTAPPPKSSVTPSVSTGNGNTPGSSATTPSEGHSAPNGNPFEALSIDNPTCQATLKSD